MLLISQKDLEEAEEIGKTPVQVNEAAGFVVNRILVPMINEAAFIKMEGVSDIAGIDEAMKQRSIETLQECYKLNYNIDYVKDHFIKFATTNKLTDAIIDAAKKIKEKGDYLSDKDYEDIHDSIERAITIKARAP